MPDSIKGQIQKMTDANRHRTTKPKGSVRNMIRESQLRLTLMLDGEDSLDPRKMERQMKEFSIPGLEEI